MPPLTMNEMVARARSRIREVTAEDLARGLEEDAVLIDVREPEEHAAERIPGSVSLPDDEFHEAFAELEPELADRQQQIRVAMNLIAEDILRAGQSMPVFMQVFREGLDGVGPMGATGTNADEIEMVTTLALRSSISLNALAIASVKCVPPSGKVRIQQRPSSAITMQSGSRRRMYGST